MDTKTVYYHSLLRDELIYEITVRSESPEDTVPKMKKQLKSLCSEFSPEEIIDEELKPSVELPNISGKLKELQSHLDNFKKTKERYQLTRSKALYCHLLHRLDRLAACKESVDAAIHASLKQKLNMCLSVLEGFVTNKSDGESSSNLQSDDCRETVVVDQSSKVNILNWNIKFSVDSSVHSFLELVNERATAFGVSDSVLFKSAFCFFHDQTLLWYRGVKDQVSSWKELSELLVEEFAPADYDYRLIGEIRSRTQGQDEPTHIYFAIMNGMFSRLKRPFSEQDKIEILLHNIRPIYAELLALHDFDTVADLKDKCRKIEVRRQQTSTFNEPSKQPCMNPEYTYKGKSPKPVTAVTQPPFSDSKPTSNKKLLCLKCKANTHSTKYCTDKRLLCFKCGEVGYTTKNCAKCKSATNSKN
ncbi:uncharacterized protein LOC135076076 [Ostrinia nubilalis]|uniref:uncharacterized protein LOC135076076 n=1 Tax=Ostrinia nubilalis TaxID=29057 RepID=UPI00308226C6